MNITSGEVAAIATVIGSVLTMLGVTGIDSGMVSAAINGVIAVATLGAAVWTFVAHRSAVNTMVAAGLHRR